MESLLPVGRGAGSEFAKSGEEAGGGAGIVEGVECDGRRKLGRLGTEANLQNVLLAYRHQSVEFGRGILFPVSAGGQNDGTGFVDVPVAFIAFVDRHSAAVGAPAMPYDLEVKIRRASEIRFKSQSFFLLVQPAQEPLNG